MFGKTTIPQPKQFQLSGSEITEDIETICLDEEQRNKLYFCLDKKPPYEHKFSKVEDFLKGTDNLEEVQQKLDSLIREVEGFIVEINGKVEHIQNKVSEYNLKS